VAHIEDRWEKVVGGQRVRAERHGSGRRWRARYLDPEGRQRSRTFARKLDAERFLATVETDKLRGAYVDPDAGRVTLREYGEEWLAGRTFDEATPGGGGLAASRTRLSAPGRPRDGRDPPLARAGLAARAAAGPRPALRARDLRQCLGHLRRRGR
jgi:hypothetical protein